MSKVEKSRGRVVTLFPSILNFQKFALCASGNWLPDFIFLFSYYSNASVEFIYCKEKSILLQVGYKTDLCVGHL